LPVLEVIYDTLGIDPANGSASQNSQIGTGIALLKAMSDTKKCAHPACNCLAAKDSKHCSQYCKDAGSTMELSCNCGHPGCALQPGAGSAPVGVK
jgi:hypothetical protein